MCMRKSRLGASSVSLKNAQNVRLTVAMVSYAESVKMHKINCLLLKSNI